MKHLSKKVVGHLFFYFGMQLFSLVISILSYIVPKDKSLFVFGSVKGSAYRGNTRALFEFLSRKSDVNAIFLTQKEAVYGEIQKGGNKSSYGFFRNMSLLLRARYVFIESVLLDVSPFYFLLGRFSIINLWHGTPLKKIGQDSKDLNPYYKLIISIMDKRFKLILANDELTKKHVSSAFRNKNVEALGYPRNDTMFCENASSQMLKSLNYKKIILFCPTFRDNSVFAPFGESFLSELNEYLSRSNYIFFIKEHPNKSVLNYAGYSNIQALPKSVDEVSDVYNVIDILIVDYSSVMFDFVLTGKPIIYYPFDYETYVAHDREIYYDYFEELPGPFAKNENDLFNLIRTDLEWFDDSGYQKKYMKFRDKFNFFQDNKSSERVYNYIISNIK